MVLKKLTHRNTTKRKQMKYNSLRNSKKNNLIVEKVRELVGRNGKRLARRIKKTKKGDEYSF